MTSIEQHNRSVFVTGTGTGVGKTVIAAILASALEADYWKPIQAGTEDGTDSSRIHNLCDGKVRIHAETYLLQMPASPHIAARREQLEIDLSRIVRSKPETNNALVIEGAGGLMVPLNHKQFVSDLIRLLALPVVLVSRNMLGSINQSLLTAQACRAAGLPVLGWIFNDDYLNYTDDIVRWSGYPHLFSVPASGNADNNFVADQATRLKKTLSDWPW